MGQRCPIKARKEHPVYGWTYTLHDQRPGNALVIWANVSQEDIVKEMDLSAKYRVGEAVQVGQWGARFIRRRKWNFKRGEFTYVIDGMRDGRDWWMGESEIERRVRTSTEQGL